MDGNQLLRLVAEQEHPAPGGLEPAAGLCQRRDRLVRQDVREVDPCLLEPLLRVVECFPQGLVELPRVLGSLQVPEDRDVAALRFGSGQMFELFEQRGLAEPAGTDQPDPVAGAVEDLGDLGGTTIEPLASHPLADDEGDRPDNGHVSSNRPTASTSSSPIVRRLASCIRLTSAMQIFWMR